MMAKYLLYISLLSLCSISFVCCINEGFTMFGPTLGQGGGIVALTSRQCVLSTPNAAFSACLLPTGNFVLINQAAQTIDFSAGSDVVAAQLGATAPFRAVMQSDNNFVVTGGQGQILFQSTAIQVPVFLYFAVTDLGTIQLQDIAGNAAWQNGIINPAGIAAIGILAGRTGYQFGLGGPNFGGVNLGGLLPQRIFNENLVLDPPTASNSNLSLSPTVFALIVVGSVLFGSLVTGLLCFARQRHQAKLNKPVVPINASNTTIANKPMSQANPPQVRPRLSLEGRTGSV